MITIDAMNLAAVDLNLLVAFEALLTERNVSRAAERIGLTQPAMSSALSRLRALFDDELFVRNPREMRPTSRALQLAGPICDALEHVRSALERPAVFEPAVAERQFTIGGTDNVDFSIAPAIARIRTGAPRIDIEIVALERAAALAMLDDGTLDIAVGLFRTVPKRFASVSLYRERYVCVCDQNFVSGANELTLESLAALPHLHVSRDASGYVEDALAARGLKRRIAMEVPNFAAVPYALEHSDLVAIVGERIARRFAALPWIVVRDPPFAQEPWTVSALWRRRNDGDQAIAWFRKQLQEACAVL